MHEACWSCYFRFNFPPKKKTRFSCLSIFIIHWTLSKYRVQFWLTSFRWHFNGSRIMVVDISFFVSIFFFSIVHDMYSLSFSISVAFTVCRTFRLSVKTMIMYFWLDKIYNYFCVCFATSSILQLKHFEYKSIPSSLKCPKWHISNGSAK